MSAKKKILAKSIGGDSRPLVGGCWPQSPTEISPKSRFTFYYVYAFLKKQDQSIIKIQ
jgi:hypothetical protein